MVLEGHQCLDVTKLHRFNLDKSTMYGQRNFHYFTKNLSDSKLTEGKFAVSEEGANFMRECIWKELDNTFVSEPVKVDEHNFLKINRKEIKGLKNVFVQIRLLYSPQLIEKIGEIIIFISRAKPTK